jgi:hypothetical protein
VSDCWYAIDGVGVARRVAANEFPIAVNVPLAIGDDNRDGIRQRRCKVSIWLRQCASPICISNTCAAVKRKENTSASLVRLKRGHATQFAYAYSRGVEKRNTIGNAAGSVFVFFCISCQEYAGLKSVRMDRTA